MGGISAFSGNKKSAILATEYTSLYFITFTNHLETAKLVYTNVFYTRLLY